MRSLWSLAHDHWTLPLWVEIHDDMAAIRVGAGLHLLTCQRAAAEERLKECGATYSRARWWLQVDQLQEIATESVAEDPEALVIWRPQAFAMKRQAVDPFYIEWCKLGPIPDPVVAEMIARSLFKHMLGWMLNQEKSVNLQFCTLHPVPYRPNWKSVILSDELGERQLPKPKSEWFQPAPMVRRGVLGHLSHSKLTFYNEEDGLFYWGIEAAPTTMWYRMVRAVEKERRRRSRTMLDYLNAFKDAVRRLLPASLTLYKRFLDEVSKPYVTARKVVNRNPTVAAPAVPIAPLDAPGNARVDGRKATSAGDVSAMPALRRGREDVRNKGGEMDQPRNGP